MNKFYKVLQQQVQPGLLMLMLISLSLLSGIGSYLYILKTPWQALGQAQQKLSDLQSEAIDVGSLSSDITTQQQLNQTLAQQLHGNGPRLPANQMAAFVIGELDRIAANHRVNLGSVRPQDPQALLTFTALNFDIEISGRYQDLYVWLKEVETQLGPLVINHFSIAPASSNTPDSQYQPVKMLLTLTNYQLQDTP